MDPSRISVSSSSWLRTLSVVNFPLVLFTVPLFHSCRLLIGSGSYNGVFGPLHSYFCLLLVDDPVFSVYLLDRRTFTESSRRRYRSTLSMDWPLQPSRFPRLTRPRHPCLVSHLFKSVLPLVVECFRDLLQGPLCKPVIYMFLCRSKRSLLPLRLVLCYSIVKCR